MGRELKRVPLDFPADPTQKQIYNLLASKTKFPGFQMWQTVSDEPYTPVFSTAEELARYCAANPWGGECDRPVSYAVWLNFINGPGWAPSMVIVDGVTMPGVEAVSTSAAPKAQSSDSAEPERGQ